MKTVIIWSLSCERLGEAKLLYVDRRKRKREMRLRAELKKCTQQFADTVISLGNLLDDESEIGETQYSKMFGTFLFLFYLFVYLFVCSLLILVNCWFIDSCKRTATTTTTTIIINDDDIDNNNNNNNNNNKL